MSGNKILRIDSVVAAERIRDNTVLVPPDYMIFSTVCPRSLDPVCIVTYYKKWGTTSGTDSTWIIMHGLVHKTKSIS